MNPDQPVIPEDPALAMQHLTAIILQLQQQVQDQAAEIQRQSQVMEATRQQASYAQQLQSQQQRRDPPEPKMHFPPPFTGRRNDARNFLMQMENIFIAQPSRYSSNDAKIRVTISLLANNPLGWANALLLNKMNGKEVTELSTWEKFRNSFLERFDDPDRIRSAERKLRALKQGRDTAAQYANNFQDIAANLDWEPKPLIAMFYEGLDEKVKDRLEQYDRPDNFNEFTQLVIRIDNRIRERRQEKQSGNQASHHSPPPFSARNSNPTPTRTSNATPMDLDNIQRRGPLSETEKQDRMKKGLCLYCAQPGHRVRDCPNKPVTARINNISLAPAEDYEALLAADDANYAADEPKNC